jgi:hypothetical protein
MASVEQRKRLRRGRDLERSLTLLRVADELVPT